MKSYVTLSQIRNKLRRKGDTGDFDLRPVCPECRNGRFQVVADAFKVNKFYRFKGISNPSDAAIPYAISSDRHNLKGVLVNTCGKCSEPVADEVMERLEIRN